MEKIYFSIKVSNDGEKWVRHYSMSSWKFDTYEKALKYVEDRKSRPEVSDGFRYFKIVKYREITEELEEKIL